MIPFILLLTYTITIIPFHVTSSLKEIDPCHTPCSRFEDGPITIFIHGTIFPGIARLMGHHEHRRGLYRYSMHPTRRTAHTRIGKALFETAPHEFPLERFYKYYWPGELSLQARKKAASELYEILKTHQGPCTIIAHSHGCNLALHLAELAHEHGKESCTKIDRLVLLAAPVQEATAHLVSSPVFKRVYACYSITDMIQVADPQKFYRDMRARKDDLPLFSKRLFPSSNKLTQAQITFDKRHPSHNDFIGVPFFKQLPHILSLLDTVHTQGCEHVRLHVPLYGNVPSVIEKKGEVRMLNAHQPSKKDRK